MITSASSRDPIVRELLGLHPRVAHVSVGVTALSFSVGPWHREVLQGSTSTELFGLAELMDNNPLVCADSMSVPSPGATLALIALGPLAAAGMIADTPTMICNVDTSDEEVTQLLAREGYPNGIIVHHEPLDFSGVVAATVMVAITTPDDLDDIDEQFEERFGRSFFVRRDEDSEWDASLVASTPVARYRVRILPDEPNSLLTIRVIADLDGKAGASQLIHAMNIMCGFEESLGIPENLPA